MSSSAGLRRSARLLGLASIGLGTAMVGSPKAVARFIGVDDSPDVVGVLTAIGAREFLAVPGLLRGRPGWAWSRVAGDAMDLTAMLIALSARGGERGQRLRNATIAVGGLALLDLITAVRSG